MERKTIDSQLPVEKKHGQSIYCYCAIAKLPTV